MRKSFIICMLIVAFVVTSFVIIGCSYKQAPAEGKSKHEKSEKQIEQPAKSVSLVFSKMDASQVLSTEYPLSEIEVKERREPHFLIYTKGEEDTVPFIGWITDNKVTEIGTLFEDHYVSDVSIQTVAVFGENMMAIQTTCGAACAVTYLLSEQNGELELFLINGTLQAVDLDKDGSQEAIVHTGSTASEIDVYRKFNGQIEKASINEALAAKSGVLFNADKGKFEVVQKEERLEYTLDITDYRLHLVTANQ